jgi:hypothetical protein
MTSGIALAVFVVLETGLLAPSHNTGNVIFFLSLAAALVVCERLA